MTAGLQLALIGGLITTIGLMALLWQLVPRRVELGDALARLSLTADTTPVDPGPVSGRERLGGWVLRGLPTVPGPLPPAKDLALLRMSTARFYGEKAMFALVGFGIGPVLGSLLAVLGWRLPWLLPVGGSVLLAVGMWFLPDYNVRDDAKKARAEASRAVGTYIELVAMERTFGSGARQSLEAAAAIGDSWIFRRIEEELAYSGWSGEAHWQALRRLADELGLAELSDLADIMRLTGDQGAQVASSLRARAAGIRAALLARDLGDANAVGEKMSIPMSLLGVIFLAILIAPVLLRITTSP